MEEEEEEEEEDLVVVVVVVTEGKSDGRARLHSMPSFGNPQPHQVSLAAAGQPSPGRLHHRTQSMGILVGPRALAPGRGAHCSHSDAYYRRIAPKPLRAPALLSGPRLHTLASLGLW